MFALALIIALLMYLPQLMSWGFGFGGAQGGTLISKAVGETGLISVSFDGGQSFREADVRFAGSPNILKIDTPDKTGGAFAARTYYAGTDQGLLMSKDDGLTWYAWSDLEKNIDATTAVYDFAYHPLDGSVYAAAEKSGYGVVFGSTDNFQTAKIIWNEPDVTARSVAADTNFLYIGLSDGRVLRYAYFEKTFEKVHTFGNAVLTLTLQNGGRTIFAALDNGAVMVSDDFGNEWKDVRDGGSFSSFAGFSGRAVAFEPDKRNPAVLYVASVSEVFRSSNGGNSWSQLDTILPDDARIAALAVDNGAIFVTSGGRLYESEDGGLTWKVQEPMPSDRRLGTLFVGNGGQVVMVGARK